jgi:predicted Ser/Thr protein kinase
MVHFLKIKYKRRKDPHKNFTKEVKMLKWARKKHKK